MRSDAVKLALGVAAVLPLGRLLLDVLFASVLVGVRGPTQSLAVLLPTLVVAGGALLLVVLAAGSLDRAVVAVAELRKAYARGDIDEEEFERRRERLTQR